MLRTCLFPSGTRETPRGWSGCVELAQALNSVLQWLVVNLPPDEFSRQTFSVLDGTPTQEMADQDWSAGFAENLSCETM